MTDTISKEHRSWNMSQVKGKDTKPEVQVRSWLFQHGFRFRKMIPDIPGNRMWCSPNIKRSFS